MKIRTLASINWPLFAKCLEFDWYSRPRIHLNEMKVPCLSRKKRVVYKLSFDQFFCSKYFRRLSSFNQSSLCLYLENGKHHHHHHHHQQQQQQGGQLWMWPVSAGDLFAQQHLRCIPAILKPSSFFLVDFRKTATYSLHPSTLPFASYKQQNTTNENLERYISCVWGQTSTNRELFPSSGFTNKDVSSVPEVTK